MEAETSAQYQLPPNCRSHLTHSLWEKKFSQLMEFKKKYGHVIVPVHWKENVQLGTWVDYLRRRRRMGKLSEEWIKILDDHGFVWEFEDKKSRRLQPNPQRKKRTAKRRKSYDFDDDDDDDEFDDGKLSQEEENPEAADESISPERDLTPSRTNRSSMERMTRRSQKSSVQPQSPPYDHRNHEVDAAYDSDTGIQALCNLACMYSSSSSAPSSPENTNLPKATKKKRGMPEEDTPSSFSPTQFDSSPVQRQLPPRCSSPTDVLMRKMSRFADPLQNQMYSEPQHLHQQDAQHQTEYSFESSYNNLADFKYYAMPLKKRNNKEILWA